MGKSKLEGDGNTAMNDAASRPIRFNFSLRELFLGVTAAACMLNWALEYRKHHDLDCWTTEEAIREMKASGKRELYLGTQFGPEEPGYYFLEFRPADSAPSIPQKPISSSPPPENLGL